MNHHTELESGGEISAEKQVVNLLKVPIISSPTVDIGKYSLSI